MATSAWNDSRVANNEAAKSLAYVVRNAARRWTSGKGDLNTVPSALRRQFVIISFEACIISISIYLDTSNYLMGHSFSATSERKKTSAQLKWTFGAAKMGRGMFAFFSFSWLIICIFFFLVDERTCRSRILALRICFIFNTNSHSFSMRVGAKHASIKTCDANRSSAFVK